MRVNRVRERWNAGEAVVSAWLSTGNSYAAEIAGYSGADCATIDLQHGMTDLSGMIGMLQAISSTPATPVVRVPSCDAALLMKSLDAGAYGVICPMVSSAEEAAYLVASTRYPPLGRRSYGPARGLLYGGRDYLECANETIVRLAMIETVEGLNAVQEICAVDGLDGVFIGPSDLGLALGKGVTMDPTDQEVRSAINRCVRAARDVGKHAGIFCPSGVVAARRIGDGFDFVVVSSDANLLKEALNNAVGAARGGMRQ